MRRWSLSGGATVAAEELGLPSGRRQDRLRFEWGSTGYLAPAVVLFAVLFLGPIIFAVFLAFTNLQLTGPHAVEYSFTGLANVHRMLSDPDFAQSTLLTVYFMLGSAIIGQSLLGMILALMMRRAMAPVRLTVSGIIVLAWVLPEVTSAFIWYAFAQSGGTLGSLLGHDHTNYLAVAPLLMVCIANLWRGVAFSMLMFSAALRNLPGDVLEAAELDGASMMRRLVRIVLPLMKRAVVTNLLLVTLGNLSTFTLIWVMTQGGPGTSTAILPVYMYMVSFAGGSDLGYGATVGLAILLLGALFSVFYIRSLRAPD